MTGQATAKRQDHGWNARRHNRNGRYLATGTHSEQLTLRLDALKHALDKGDADTWSELARGLTETTTRLGAMGMMKLCIALQMQGRRNLLVRARETFEELTGEFARFKENLIAVE